MLLENLEVIIGRKKKIFGRIGTNIAVQERIFDCVVENMGAGRSELHIAWKGLQNSIELNSSCPFMKQVYPLFT